MKSACETLEGNQVKLSVEIDEAEFDRNIEAAFRKIAKEVRMPGFRPGKAPRKVLEARIGMEAARSQAIQDAIPQYLSKAVREHNVDLVATPDVNVTEGQESGVVKFDATCEVRPVITIPGYAGLRVELASPELSDEEMQEAVDAELRRHGDLVDSDDPAATGDYVIIDLQGLRNGEPVPGLNVDEWTYEIGRGWVAPGFDEKLAGAKKGDELKFSAVPNGTEEEADFEVKVQKVQKMRLPELTDQWVKDTIADFETVEAWKASIRERMTEMRTNTMRRTLVDRVTDALIELVEIEAPESMVAQDLQSRVQNTINQFQQQGIALDQWLSATGQDTNSFIEGLRTQSVKAVKVDLALRAVAEAEGIEVSDHELDMEFEAAAMQFGEKPEKVRKAYEQNDAIPELASQIRKQKSLDWLLHHVTYVDQHGATLVNDDVLGHSEADHANHNHDQSAEGAE